ncbi:MAG: hypothetical protein IKP50_04655 [Bacilli bacterium]|nr:hypothetical protein [Bacilli bacterium]
MKKNKIFALTAISMTTILLSTLAISKFSKNSSSRLFALGETETWNHYSLVNPSLQNKGSKEYWVSCSSHLHQFSAPSGENIEIVDAGAPNSAFINGLQSDDDRLLQKLDSYIDFERTDVNVLSAGVLSTYIDNEASISSEQSLSGSKSMKVIISAAWSRTLVISNEFYDMLPEAGITFSLYCSDQFNANVANGGTALHYYNPVNEWKKYTVPKASINSTSGDHYVLLVGAATTVYIDDVRPAESSIYVDFEDNSYSAATNVEYVVNVDDRNTNSISTEQAFTGTHSLKVVAGDANYMGFKLSDALYNALPDEGLSFALYALSAFNGNTVGGEGHQVKAYNPNQWEEFTVAKADIDTSAGRHYVFTFAAAATFYVDAIRPANSAAGGIDFEDRGFEDAFIRAYSVRADSRDTYSISNEHALSGTHSMKVVTSGTYHKALILSDALYNALPSEGVTFFVWCNDAAFNGNTGGDAIHYWDPLGEWKEYTVPKASINSTAGDHYVFLPSIAGTLYIDCVSPASAV